MTSRPKPLVLCILDGWGERPNGADNAIDRAKTPVWHELMRRWPHAQLNASEHYVGLPNGQMGNSAVGHTNIGAGLNGPRQALGPGRESLCGADRRRRRACR